MSSFRRFCSTVSALALFLGMSSAADIATKKLQVLISAAETSSQTDTNWTYAWSFDGQWAAQGKRSTLELTTDSDYSRSEKATTDHLLNSLRWIGAREPVEQGWKPVLLAQTEGDHGFDDATLLLAAGARRTYQYGFVELTAGSSRNIGRDDDWVGDIGLAFAYERNLSKRWKVRTGPKAQYGTMGQVRLRDDRLRYSWDMNLDYRVTDKCSLGYRLWTGNTQSSTQRTQWVGLNFKLK